MDEVALVDRGQEYSGAEVHKAIIDTAAAVLNSGIKPGERVLIVIPNGLDFVAAFLGVALMGGVAVPTWPDTSEERLADLKKLCGATLIMGEDSPLLKAGGNVPNPWPDPPELAMLQYTSGSTGNPKGVMLSHHCLITNSLQMCEGFCATSDDIFYSWLPACHDLGLVLMLLSPLAIGCTLHLERPGMPAMKGWMQRCAEVGATMTGGPDFAWRMALRTLGKNDAPKPKLKMALNAAEPIRSATMDAIKETFGVMGTPGYGLAEATVGVCGDKPWQPYRADEKGNICVGKPFPGVELRIADDEGKILEPGNVGHVEVQSPSLCMGYWDNPDATAKLFTEDGWLRTGDFGYLDDIGDLRISGRAKSIIIVAGRTVAAQEVEETVDELAGVRRSAAIPMDRGGDMGEQLAVLIELRPQAEKSDLQLLHATAVKAVEARLGFPPGKVLLLQRQSIPLTKNGKIKHALLAADLQSGELAKLVLFPEHERRP